VAAREIHVELLLNRRVYALNGRAIGLIEEVRAEARGKTCVVTEYLVGVYGLFERLAAWPIGRSMLRAVRLKREGSGYRVLWNQMDLGDAQRPRLRCPVSELAPMEIDGDEGQRVSMSARQKK
jgi:hypothetical protein